MAAPPAVAAPAPASPPEPAPTFDAAPGTTLNAGLEDRELRSLTLGRGTVAWA